MNPIHVPGDRVFTMVSAKTPPCPMPVARGLNRQQAAAYVGVSPSLFDQMIEDGRMPKPRKANSRTIWDRLALDRAFDRLPGGEGFESKLADTDWDTEA